MPFPPHAGQGQLAPVFWAPPGTPAPSKAHRGIYPDSAYWAESGEYPSGEYPPGCGCGHPKRTGPPTCPRAEILAQLGGVATIEGDNGVHTPELWISCLPLDSKQIANLNLNLPVKRTQ